VDGWLSLVCALFVAVANEGDFMEVNQIGECIILCKFVLECGEANICQVIKVFEASRCKIMNEVVEFFQVLKTLEFLNEHPATKVFQRSSERLVGVIVRREHGVSDRDGNAHHMCGLQQHK
jgi:hypothetical protein